MWRLSACLSPGRYLTLLDCYFFAAYAVLLLSVATLLIPPDVAPHARALLATTTYLLWVGLHGAVFLLQELCSVLSQSWERLAEQNAANGGLLPSVTPATRRLPHSAMSGTSPGQPNLI